MSKDSLGCQEMEGVEEGNMVSNLAVLSRVPL